MKAEHKAPGHQTCPNCWEVVDAVDFKYVIDNVVDCQNNDWQGVSGLKWELQPVSQHPSKDDNGGDATNDNQNPKQVLESVK